MYEGMKIENGGKIIDLNNLPKNENGELILENIKGLKILINENAKYGENVEILENNSDVKISLIDEAGNSISIILKGLNDILLANDGETPVFEVFQGTEKLASMTTIDDLEAAAAGGETITSGQDGNPDGAGDLGGTESGPLAGRIGGLTTGAPGDATDPTYAYDVTFTSGLTGVAVEDFSDSSGILVNDDPHYGPQPYVPATIVGTFGTFTIDEAGNWFYDLDHSNPAVQALADGETLSESFTAQIQDLPFSQAVGITIQGTNDQPVIEDITIEDVNGQVVDFYEDGSFVTAWIEYTRTEIDFDQVEGDGQEFPFDGRYDGPFIIVKTIYAQKYDANGNKVGEQVEVETLDDNSYIRSDIFSLIALSDGGFTVNWSTDGDEGRTLAYERFNADGTSTHEQVFASSDEEAYLKKAQAIELNDGSIAVIWKQSSGKEGNEIFVQKYDASGNPIGDPILITSEESGDENIDIDLKEFELEAFGESGFSVVWSQNVYESIYEGLIQLDSNEYRSLNSIIVDSDGNVSNPLEVSRTDDYVYYYSKNHPEFSQLQDNGIITWVDSQTGEFIGQLISNSNELIGEPIVLLDEYDGSRYQSSPDIAVLGDGSFVVTWLEYTYSDLEEQDEKKEIDGEYKVLSQFFNADAEPIGEVIEVYQGYANLGTPAHFDPSIFDVRGTEDGGFSIAWFNNEFSGGKMSKDSEIEGADNLFYHFKFDSEGNLVYSNNPTQNYETKDGTNVFTGDLTVEDVDASNTHVFRVVEGTVEIVNNELENDIFDGPRPSAIGPDFEEIPQEPLPIPEVTISLENGQYNIEGDFNYLAVGESVTITFQYVADDQRGFDGTDGIHESSISEPKTITVTIKGTNDQPVLESLVNDGETVFETSKNNTGIEPEEPINTITGTITANDDDIHDTHNFRLQYIDDGQEFLEQDENYSKSYQEIDYKRYADQMFNDYTNNTRVVVESNDINADSITIEEIRLLTNDRADSQIGFELDGDFKALGVGETATVTFEVIGDDYRGFGNDGNELHEASRSEPHYVTITVEGTNDQPVVRDVNANGVNNYDVQEVSNDSRYAANTSVAGLSDGGYIVTWRGYPEQGGNSEIFAQRYDAANNPVGSIFQVNAEDYNYDTNPEVVGLSDGGFVITWRGYDSDDKIFLQKFDENGNKVGGEVLVNTQQGSEDNYNPAIAATGDGGYIVTWYSYEYNPFGSSSYEIYMQRFDSTGSKLGVETQVSLTDAQSDYNPEIAVLPDGGFVVTWQGYDGAYSNIFMQIFDNSGNKVGTETVVNESDFNHDYQPSIAAFADGSFIITWYSYENGNSEIFAQKFDVNGSKVGSEFMVNIDDSTSDYQPKVTVLDNGDYVITWTGYDQGSTKVYLQKFDNAGNKIGEEQAITDGVNNGRPDITALEDGGFVVSYDGQEYIDNQSEYTISSQRFGGGATLYESHDDDNEPDEYDDGENNTQDDVLSYFEGSLVSFASDNDVNDVLTYYLVDGSVTIDNLAEDYTFPEVTVNEVTGEYDVQGDFNYLAAGETTTVTFDYFVEDNQGITDVNDPNHELSRSENATVTLTITGTNDQPIIEDVSAVVTEESLIDTDFEDFRYEGSVANSVTDDDDTDTHTFAIDEGTLTLSVTTTNQKFLDFFDVDTLEAIEQMVDDNTDINQIIDFIVTNDDNNDIADSVTIETAQEFTIPQNIISMLAQYGLLTITMDANGDYSIESPIFNMLGAHDSITVGFDFRATDHNDIRDPQDLTFDGTDGINESSVSEAQTVTVTIEGTNDKPVAIPDDYTSLESQLATTDTETETGSVHTTFSGLLPGASTGDALGDIFNRFGDFDEDLLDLATMTFHLETDIDSYPNAEILTEVTEEFPVDQVDDVMVIDPEQTTVTIAEDGSFIVDNPTFDNLAVGETAKVTFQYYINDQSGAVGTPDNQHESVRSEPATVTVTITGTNDKPLVHDVTLGINDPDTKKNETIYESRDKKFYENDIDDTQDDVNTKIKGELVAIDDDVNDEHVFNSRSYTANKYYGEGNGGPGQNGEEGDRRFDEIDFFQKGPNNGSETIKVMIESEAVDVHNLDVSKLVFKNNNGEDSKINFELLGDFNALAEGETAVVTFQYIANDKRGFGKDGDTDNEASISEPKLVTMTITGTNDQPIVDNIILGAQVFTAVDTPLDIPEIGIVTSEIEVSNVASLDDLNVTINLNHTWDNDLDIYLKAPDGTIVELTSDNGGASDNYRNTEFNDEANQDITDGRAPFRGVFRPEGDLSDFDNLNPNGTWTLIIEDDFVFDTGTLFSWSLEFNSETYFESYTESIDDIIGVDDTEGDDTGAINENLTVLSNILTAHDDDNNDTHTMHITDMAVVPTTEDVMTQTIAYEDGIASDNDTNDNTRVVKVESSDVDVSSLRIDRIELSNNDDATDSQSNFDLYGDFSSLAAGESATITFAYQAEDSSITQKKGESEFSEVKTVTITVTGTNDKPIVSQESYDINDETYGDTYYETSDLDNRDDYDTDGYNWDIGGHTQDDEDGNVLKGKISVEDIDTNDKHHFYVVDTAGNYAEDIWSNDGNTDWKNWVTVESGDIAPNNIDLSSIKLLNGTDGYFSTLDEIEFELKGNFSKLGAGQEATVTFSYIAVDDSQQHLPGESNTSEVKTVTLTVTGTNDEPIIWSVDNGDGVYETTIATAAMQAEANVLAAGGTQAEADAAKLAAMSMQTQADRFGNDIDVPVEVRTSYFNTISGFDIDIEDTHTLHMKDTTSTGDTITVSTDDGDMQAAFSATAGISASDIENLSIDFRTLVDDQTSAHQTYSYLITGDFSALGRGESATIVFDYVARDDSSTDPARPDESSESDVKQITFIINGTNDQPVVTAYDSTSEITETNQPLDLPLAQLQQIAYDAAYNEIMDPFSNPLIIATQFGGDIAAYTQAVLEAEAEAIMAGNIAREAVVADDTLTVYGDGLGTIYDNDVIEGHDDDINDKHALFLTDLASTTPAEELLIDFSTSNGTFNDTGTDVKAVFTSDSANVTADDIKDVSVIFETTSDVLGSNEQQYTYQVVGNYNALGNGETATITFAYVVKDDLEGPNGPNDEQLESEVHEITLTITGTNDKPIVQADSDSVLESTTGPVTSITTQFEVEDADDTDMVEGHIFHIQDALPLSEVDFNDIYSIRYVNIDTNTIGFVQVEIDGPLQDIDTTKITLVIDGDDLTLQGEFDPLAGAYTDNSGTDIPAEELAFRFKYFADDQNGFDGTDGSNENSLSDSQWMTITITGTNDVPTIVDKNLPAAMDEDRHVDNGMLKTFGSVEVDDVDHGQDYFSTTVTPPSNDIGGTFNFNEDGTWDYEVDNSLQAVQALKENEYIDQTYIVTSIDGTDTHPITVRIWGTEDISIIKDTSVLSGEVTEDATPVTLSTTGALFIIDPDNFPDEAAFNTAGVFNAGLSDGVQLGTLTLVNQAPNARIYPEGQAQWTYSVDNTDIRVQELGVGESIKQVFTITSADGNSSENVIITIKGTNDVPTLEAITSSSIVDTEAVDVFADIVGSLSGDDVDVNASLTYSVSGTDLDPRDGVIEVEGNYGTLVLITSSGEYTYTPDADKINALSVDAIDTFTFVANDGIVDSLPQDLVINITAADDTPIIVDEPDFSVVEDGAVFNGILEATDVDTTTLTYEVVGATPAGLTVNPNGTYNFDPSVDAYQSLNAGQTTQVSFQWKATDGNSDTATDTVTVTIMGTNDGATIINPENFTVQAEQEQNFLRLDTNGQVIEDASQALNMADFARVGTGIKALDVTGTVGPSQNGNNWNDAFSFVLLAGESALVTLEDATPADSLVTIYQIVAPNTYVEVPSANGAGDYVVRIASSNPAGSADFKLRIAIIGDDVKEDTITTISGEMEVIDVDAGENIFKELTDVVLPNGYGEFSISPTGTWTYELFNSDPRIQALAEGEELFETFTVESFDGTATEDITIRIEGTNDLPVATVHTAILVDTTGPDNLSTSVDVVTDDRVADTNDISETYSIKDGSVSIASITVDGVPAIVAGLTAIKNGDNIDFTAGDAFDFLDNAEVAEVTINYMLDDGTQAVPSTLVITVNGTNDLPIITSVNTFTINEHDALDHASYDAIESNAYDQTMTVAQNEANGALVGQITATDAENDTLEYQLVKVNGVSTGDISYQDIFHVNTSDGKIYLKQNVDAETLDTYTLDVRVVGFNTDGTTNYATQQITVNVSDLNDNAPVLAVTGVLADVDENSQGTTLATLTVTDADGTPPNAVQAVGNFTITGADAALVEVVDNSGTFELRLKTDADLDFEEPNTNLDVNVVYNDGLHNSNQEPVSITVNDLNDNAPVLAVTGVLADVDENSQGTTLATLTVTDADGTPPNAVQAVGNFTITGADAALVEVVNNSGTFELRLKTDADLDFEEPNTNLDVNVVYNDGLHNSNQEPVSISVNDVNEAPILVDDILNHSTFEDDLYTYNIAGHFNDIDDGDSLTYSILSGPTWLSILNGELTGTPTNDDVGSVLVTVRATDIGNLSKDETFLLTIYNTNDTPEVTTIIADQYTNEDELYSYDVTSHFNDIDVGDTLTYTATNLPTGLSISSDGTITGRPTVAGVYDITVTATDDGNPNLSIDDTFTLSVNNVVSSDIEYNFNNEAAVTGVPTPYSYNATDGTGSAIRTFASQSDINEYSGSRTITIGVKSNNPTTTTQQVIYEEGGNVNGINVYVLAGKLYARIWEESENPDVSILLQTSIDDQPHAIYFVFDDENNRLSLYKDGLLEDYAQVTDSLINGLFPAHTDGNAVGGVNNDTDLADASGNLVAVGNGGYQFDGEIEVAIYNNADVGIIGTINNDTIEFNSNALKIDGQNGEDVLDFGSINSTFDFAAVLDGAIKNADNSETKIENIEFFDLNSGTHILSNISIADVIAMTDENNILKVEGDLGDEIRLDMTEWQVDDSNGDSHDAISNPQTNSDGDNDGFVTYTNSSNDVQLLINEDIDVKLV